MGELWDALRSAMSLEPLRAFTSTDPSQSSPHVTALAPSGQGPYTVPSSDPNASALFRDSVPVPQPMIGASATGPVLPPQVDANVQPTMHAAGGSR